jgi:uncharacterized protein (TIGR02145 family)
MKKTISKLAVIILIAACNKSSTTATIPPLTDIDGNVYGTVKTCTQIWMKQNLNTSHYRNGDPIPKVTDTTAWNALNTGAWCWYNNDSATYAATYGKLYNGYAINDPRGIAPVGWHLPSDAEWTILENCLGGFSVAGGAMKESGTTHWIAPNGGATNSSGFTGLPGGYRSGIGSFDNIKLYGFWWSTTEFDQYSLWSRNLYFDNKYMGRVINGKRIGLSVRCIRD